jgi:hypothetical protein
MIPIHPDTIATIKNAAPISSPIAKDPAFESIALYVYNIYINTHYINSHPKGVYFLVYYLNVLNKSGLPLPKAKIVTPAMLSDNCNLEEIVCKLGPTVVV